MARLGLLFAAFFLLAFSKGSEGYYRENIDEAHKLVEGDCRKYLSSAHSRIEQLFKNDECDVAAKVVADEVELASQKALIESLGKFIDSLDSVNEFSDDENLRYLVYTTEFSKHPAQAEDLIIKCMGNKDKKLQNGPSCRAAAETILSNLKKEQEINLQKLTGEEKYKENYKRYFEQNPDKVNELLEGKCKKLLENPWYKFDYTLQDKECDGALAARNKVIEKKIRSKEYFNQNLNEAQSLISTCKSEDSAALPEECDNAAMALKESSATEKKGVKYNIYFKDRLDEAKNVAAACPPRLNLSTDEGLKCRSALIIVNKELKIIKDSTQINKYKEILQHNIEEAYSIFSGRCKNSIIAENGEEDAQCKAAMEVVADDVAAKSRDSLIDKLKSIQNKYNDYVASISEKEKSTYKKYFVEHQAEAEELVTLCIQEDADTAKNPIQCNAAVSALLTILVKNRELAEDAKTQKLKNKEYYQRYFAENPKEIEAVLNGRCKQVFADPWYRKDSGLGDPECDTAVVLSRYNADEERAKAIAQNRREIKDKTYFIKNFAEAENLSANCRNGEVLDLDECETAIYVVNEKKLEEGRRIEYTAYYNDHPLAAKFQVRWCKTVMLHYNIKCQAAEDAVVKYSATKPKKYSEKLFMKKMKSLSRNAEKVKELLKGKCNELFKDPWYYLDESIRNEECDAAAELALIAVEKQAKEKAKKEGGSKE